MPTSPFLSVVIPSYNEAQNLRRGVLDEVVRYLKSKPYTWEVILSDDGSSDSTPAQLDEFAQTHAGVSVLHNPHAGKGPTVQSGMLAANGQWRLFTDFDQSTPLSELEKLLKFTDEFEVILGSREMIGSSRDEEPWYRHLMGRGFNWLVQVIAIPGILDTQCGFKLFSAAATQKLFSHLYIYDRHSPITRAFTGAFDVELLFLAKKYKLAVREVAIEWHHHETNRVSPVWDSLLMLRDIIRIRLADAQGKYV